jgi:hypothetical protein
MNATNIPEITIPGSLFDRLITTLDKGLQREALKSGWFYAKEGYTIKKI